MLNKIRINSQSEENTISIGKAIGAVIQSGDMITLVGNLGSGKTRLVKGIISQALAIPIDEIISPSFTLVNRYEGPITIDHADLYRVGPGAVEELGLLEIIDSEGVLLIEWADNETPVLKHELRVTILYGMDPDFRFLNFEFEVPGAWETRLPRAVEKFQHS